MDVHITVPLHRDVSLLGELKALVLPFTDLTLPPSSTSALSPFPVPYCTTGIFDYCNAAQCHSFSPVPPFNGLDLEVWEKLQHCTGNMSGTHHSGEEQETGIETFFLAESLICVSAPVRWPSPYFRVFVSSMNQLSIKELIKKQNWITATSATVESTMEFNWKKHANHGEWFFLDHTALTARGTETSLIHQLTGTQAEERLQDSLSGFKSHVNLLWCHSCLPVFSFCPPSLLPSCSVSPSTQSPLLQTSPTFCVIPIRQHLPLRRFQNYRIVLLYLLTPWVNVAPTRFNGNCSVSQSQHVVLPPWAKYPSSSELGPLGAGFSLPPFSHPAALPCAPGLAMLLPRECPQNLGRALLSAGRRERGISLGCQRLS